MTRPGFKGFSIFQFLLALGVAAALVSCASSGYTPIPGEKEAVLGNLAVEYFSIAENYTQQKQYGKAVEYYQKARTLDSGNNLYTYKLARAYALNKQWAESQKLIEKLLKDDEGNTALRETLAYLYAQQNMVDRSLALYRELYAENPLNNHVLLNYGLLSVHTDDLETAVQLLLELEDINPAGDEYKKLSKAVEDAKKKDGEEPEPSGS